MARKTKQVTITWGDASSNRDFGKVFVITEKSATAAEKWAQRAFWALGRMGIEVPEDIVRAGAAAILTMGVRALMSVSFIDAEPLLDEMMECVQVMPDPSKPIVVRALIDDDTEEVKTRLLLRDEVIELHTGFSLAASLSKLGAAMKGENISDTPTSPRPSEPLSETA